MGAGTAVAPTANEKDDVRGRGELEGESPRGASGGFVDDGSGLAAPDQPLLLPRAGEDGRDRERLTSEGEWLGDTAACGRPPTCSGVPTRSAKLPTAVCSGETGTG